MTCAAMLASGSPAACHAGVEDQLEASVGGRAEGLARVNRTVLEHKMTLRHSAS
jgi:hypothetical protein